MGQLLSSTNLYQSFKSEINLHLSEYTSYSMDLSTATSQTAQGSALLLNFTSHFPTSTMSSIFPSNVPKLKYQSFDSTKYPPDLPTDVRDSTQLVSSFSNSSLILPSTHKSTFSTDISIYFSEAPDSPTFPSNIETSFLPSINFSFNSVENLTALHYNFTSTESWLNVSSNPRFTSSFNVTLDKILSECAASFTGKYPFFSNLSESDQTHLLCDYCELSDQNLDVLYSDQTCIKSTYELLPLVITAYSILFLMGLIANVLVLTSMAKDRGKSKNPTTLHLFLGNLVLGDLLTILTCVPFTVIPVMVLHYWPFSEALCRIVSYLQAVSIFVSSYSLVSVSIERYLVILKKQRLSLLKARLALIIIWMMAFVTSVPIAVFSTLYVPGEGYHVHHGLPVCREIWPDNRLIFSQVYSVLLLILQYFLPVVVLVFTYSRIGCTLQMSRARLASFASLPSISAVSQTLTRESSSRLQPSWSRVRKLVRFTLTVTVAYTVCWMPFNLQMVLQYFLPDLMFRPNYHYAFMVCHWLAMSHAVINPILLYWLNKTIRLAILRQVSSMCCPCVRPSIECRILVTMGTKRRGVQSSSGDEGGRDSATRRRASDYAVLYPLVSSPITRPKQDGQCVQTPYTQQISQTTTYTDVEHRVSLETRASNVETQTNCPEPGFSTLEHQNIRPTPQVDSPQPKYLNALDTSLKYAVDSLETRVSSLQPPKINHDLMCRNSELRCYNSLIERTNISSTNSVTELEEISLELQNMSLQSNGNCPQPIGSIPISQETYFYPISEIETSIKDKSMTTSFVIDTRCASVYDKTPIPLKDNDTRRKNSV